MKATAVEWLANRIIELEERLRHKEINLNDFMDLKDELVEQAKEMEKEQIIDFGYDIADELACGKYWDKKAMEERYNEFLMYNQEEE